MQVFCLVHRLDEDEVDGVIFTTVKEAHDHMKERALAEDKTVSDYTIKPIETNEL